MVSQLKNLPVLTSAILLLIVLFAGSTFLWQNFFRPAPLPLTEPTSPPIQTAPVVSEPAATPEGTPSAPELEPTPIENGEKPLPSEVVVATDQTHTAFTILVDREPVATISTTAESEAEVLSFSEESAFIGLSSLGLGGYILYGGWQELYRLTLATGETEKIAIDGFISGASINNDQVGIIRRDEANDILLVVIHTLADGSEVSFPVNPRFRQAGDIRFSPFGRQVAFAAAVGDPEAESGQVVIIDLDTGQQTTVDQAEKGYFIVKGWTDRDTVDYELQ